MKNKKAITFILLILVCAFCGCKKKQADTPQTELEKLPPATQTGANTFGALVNGQAFLPHTSFYSYVSPYQCNYIYTNGGYYLTVAGTMEVNTDYHDIVLGTNLLPITEGTTLKLENSNENGKASGLYYLITGTTVRYSTTTYVSGQLYISHFDQVKQVVSGTFFFDAIDQNGNTVHITDGRFDMQYTR
jgi:hypothetical protein